MVRKNHAAKNIYKKISVLLAAGFLFTTAVQDVPGNIVYASETLSESTDTAESDGDNSSVIGEKVTDEDGHEYIEGEVLVTIASPKKTVLARKGSEISDEDITVEQSWDFGTAEDLGTTQAQRSYLAEKELYVSEVSSDNYTTEELIEKLKDNAYVVSAEPNYVQKLASVTSDTYSDSQWYLTGLTDKNSKGINYTRSESKGDTPVVAVVDTGVNYNHEDLKEHMWVNTYSSLEGVCGYDFGGNDADPMDTDGHGTHCAGVIGAVTDNNTGIAGVADDVKIMALRVLDRDDNVSNSGIIGAFNYIYQAQKLGVNVRAVNCSWGGGSTGSELETIMNKIGSAGALFIFASGNDGINTDSVSAEKLGTPYNIDCDYIVNVGASTTSDQAASFSDYGKKTVDLFAPGDAIFSCVLSETFQPSAYSEEKRQKLTSLYSSCTAEDLTLYTPDELGISTRGISYSGVTHSSYGSYSDTTTGSYLLKFSSSGRADASVYLDVDALGLSSSDTYYVACDTAVLYTGGEKEEPEWEHFQRKNSATDYVTINGKQYMRLMTLTNVSAQTVGLYFDNIAISSANPDTSEFGCYDYMSGTSMAAPMVSGGVAALAAMFPGETAIQMKERLCSFVRTESSVSSKCVTGGIMDMSLFASSKYSTTSSSDSNSSSNGSSNSNADSNSSVTGKVSVTKVTLNKTSATLRYSKKLKLKATVTPSDAFNKKVKWSVSHSKYAKVTQKGVVTAKKKGIGHKVKITAAAKDGSGKKAVCTVKIKKA